MGTCYSCLKPSSSLPAALRIKLLGTAQKALRDLAVALLLTSASSKPPLIYCGPTTTAFLLFSLPGLEWPSVFSQMLTHLSPFCSGSLSTKAASARSPPGFCHQRALRSPSTTCPRPPCCFLCSAYHCSHSSHGFVALTAIRPHPLLVQQLTARP